MTLEWTTCKRDNLEAQALANVLGLNPITACVLLNRGIDTPEKARVFLDPSLSHVPDPYELPDMQKAVGRIASAIGRKERIGIFGDYDVDGIAASALLFRVLLSFGAKAIVSLPNRNEDGYGLSRRAIREFSSQGVNLIITVDNGARAQDEISMARGLGIEAVVTDHHQADGPLKDAVATVNPARRDLNCAHSHLCGVGVAFVLALALKEKLHGRSLFGCADTDLHQHLDLVALGTIADVVPLVGVNRILARHGLGKIADSTKAGIRALIEVSETNTELLSPEAVGFQLGPRINAVGRLGDPRAAFELLATDDDARAEALANLLDKTNRKRQQIEDIIIADALTKIEKDSKNSAIVVANRGWHVGVVGVVASKLAEKFSRPSVVITLDTKPARGSVRGVDGVNIVDVLSRCSSSLVKFGGHEKAAGLSIEEEKIGEFARGFDAEIKTLPSCGQKRLLIDSYVSAKEITPSLVKELGRCQPFGEGNAEPRLAINDMEIVSRRVVGTNHLKLKVRSAGLTFDAIGFRMADALSTSTARASVAFTPEFNTWNGYTSIQLKLKDIKCTT